jgi:hypothetical protein
LIEAGDGRSIPTTACGDFAVVFVNYALRFDATAGR